MTNKGLRSIAVVGCVIFCCAVGVIASVQAGDTTPPTIQIIKPASLSVNTTGYINITAEVVDPVDSSDDRSGLVDMVNTSVWDATGYFLDVWNEAFQRLEKLDNRTMYMINDNKFSYRVSAFNLSLFQYVPLPNGNYSYVVYANDIRGNKAASDAKVVKVKIARGDMNGDGEVAFSDVVALAKHIYFGDPVSDEPDVNGDGEVAFSDVVALAKHIYFGDPIYP